jgi:hypothetical protein
MKTEDILALGNRPYAEQRPAFDRPGVVVWAILAGLFIGIMFVNECLSNAQASVPDERETRMFSTNLDRSGALYTLEIQF